MHSFWHFLAISVIPATLSFIISLICGAINISTFMTKWHLVCKWNLSKHLYQHGSNQIAWLLCITSREHIREIKRDIHTQVESASQGIAIVTSLCETYSVRFPASRDPLSLVYLGTLHLHLSVKPPSAPTPCNPFQVPMYPHIASNPSCFEHVPAPQYAGWEVLACSKVMSTSYFEDRCKFASSWWEASQFGCRGHVTALSA